MPADGDFTARFEAERAHLRGVAYRMLGSLDEADDAVQSAWLRAEQAGVDGVTNLRAWLTTIVARVCLDVLRARRPREVPPPDDHPSPESEIALAESVGLALLVVMDRLSPAERVAFVLHDLFGVAFDEIAAVVGRSEVATKKLASRARARVRGVTSVRRANRAEHHAIVEAFLVAARSGELATLVTLLAPDVVRRADDTAVPADVAKVVRGAKNVADETRVFAHRARVAAVALIDGQPGIVVAPRGRLALALRVTIVGARIVELDVVGDPARLARLEITSP